MPHDSVYRCKVCWSKPVANGKHEYVCETLVTLEPLDGITAVYRVEVLALIGIEPGWLMTNQGRRYRVLGVEACSPGKVAAILGRWTPANSTSAS